MLYDGARAIDAFVRQGGHAAWFADPMAARTGATILDMHSRGIPVDLVLVRQHDATIPSDYLIGCVDAAIVPANAQAYIEALEGLAMLRAARDAVTYGATRLDETLPEDARNAVDAILDSLREIAKGHADAPTPMDETARGVIEEWTHPERSTRILPWPLERITRAMGGMDAELIWLVAQPSVGKTAFALQTCLVIAERVGPVSIASLESSRRKIAGRLISCMGKVDTLRMRRGQATAAEVAQAMDAAGRLRELPLRVSDAGMTLEQVYAWGRSEAERGARLLVVDNTRHIRNPNGREGRVEFMGSVSARLKQLRDDTGVPLMVLHHSSKPNDRGRDDVSWTSDVRRDADCLVFLRDDEDNSTAPTEQGDNGVSCVNFQCEKNRDGVRSISVAMEFEKWRQTFVDWEGL